MSEKRKNHVLITAAAAGAAATAGIVYTRKSGKKKKTVVSPAPERPRYRNTELGMHEKNSKGIYYTNVITRRLPTRKSRRVLKIRARI